MKNQGFSSGLRAEISQDENEAKKILRGYPILFDSPARIGLWTEYVRKGALDGVDFSKLVLLASHSENLLPFAKVGVNMRAVVDDTGLFIEVELGNTEFDEVLYDRVKRGIMDGMSYWFGASGIKQDSNNKTVEILKFDWINEVSIVTFPAYPETVVIAYEAEILALENTRDDINSKQKFMCCL